MPVVHAKQWLSLREGLGYFRRLERLIVFREGHFAQVSVISSELLAIEVHYFFAERPEMGEPMQIC
jgi:hypothetical protein